MSNEKIKIGKREFPFKVNAGLKELVKEAHVNLELVKDQKPRESKRFAYLAVKSSCAEAGEDFAYTFEEFMNFVEPDCAKKASLLAAKMLPKPKPKRKNRKVKAPAEATPKKEESKAGKADKAKTAKEDQPKAAESK